jgi:hypothetical protein
VVKVSDFGLLKEQDSTLTKTESELRRSIFDPTIESFRFESYRGHQKAARSPKRDLALLEITSDLQNWSIFSEAGNGCTLCTP